MFEVDVLYVAVTDTGHLGTTIMTTNDDTQTPAYNSNEEGANESASEIEKI